MLYEVLKTAKMGAGKAPDLYTALLAKNLRRDGEVKTLSGIPPLTFQSNGQPLLDYLISGNTVQNGTPTPQNPVDVNGCGERTGNLFDGDFTVAVMSVSGNTATLNTASSGRTAIVECEPNTTYTVKKHSVSNRFIIAESDIKPVNGTSMSIIQNNSSISEYTFTTSNAAQYVAIYCSTSSEQAEPQLMLNTGSTPLPYEPYGYKIPISSASTTTPVYLGEVETTRKVKKLVLTGEENWVLSNNRLMYTVKTTKAVSYESVLCTHYTSSKSFIEVYNTTNSTAVTNQGIYVNSGSTDIADFKAYLATQYAAGTPVTVWYVLATPETGITNEPLMKIGDYADTLSMEQAGAQIPTAKGSTTLDVETAVKPSEVYIKYKS